MIRAKAKQLAITFVLLMLIIFLITDYASSAYAKAVNPSQLVTTSILVLNILAFVWFFIGLIFLFFIWRGRFHFQDDLPAGAPPRVPSQPRGGLLGAFQGKPKNQTGSNYMQTVLPNCQNCGHPLKEKLVERGLDQKGKQLVESKLEHETSYPDLRSGITYCSINQNGKICGCESPSLPKPQNCMNCGHLLDPTNTKHYEEYPDLRTGIAYCKVSMPTGGVCGCENINAARSKPAPMERFNRPMSQPPNMQAGQRYQDTQTRHIDKPQADKPSNVQSAHNELIESLTQDLVGGNQKEETQEETEEQETSPEEEPPKAPKEVRRQVAPKPVEQDTMPKRGRGRPKGSFKKAKPNPSAPKQVESTPEGEEAEEPLEAPQEEARVAGL